MRRADIIEKLHDGSIVDDFSELNAAKLLYSSFTWLAMLPLIISGFLPMAQPKSLRKIKQISLV